MENDPPVATDDNVAETTGNPRVGINRNVILIISTTTAFILPFLMASVNVALPTISRQFGMEAVVMSWVSTVYLLAIAMVQVPFGRLSDIYGRKKLFVVGLLIATFSSFLGAFANSVPLLMVSRALQGMGAGMTFNNSVAILTSLFPSDERGRALGISMAGTYGGLAMGPLIGGFMTEHFGWGSIFFLAGLLGVMLVVLVFWGLKGEWREARGEKFDVVGSIAYSISIALFMYGFSVMPTVTGIIFFAAGFIGLIFFVRWESRVASPVFDLSLFRENRLFLLSNLAALITYLSTFAVTFLLSLYLQYIKGFSPQTAGLALLPASVLMTIFTPISGRISDKVEPRLVATVGMALNCVTVILLVFLNNDTAVWFIIVALALYGIGIGLFSSPNTNAIMGSVEKRALGVASGTLGTMRTAGMMLSMGIMMILFSLYIGQAEISPPYYPQFMSSVRTGFIVFTVLCIGGLLAQLLARAAREKPVAD
jgi:EmrB/QacA subfamily drug resistance transporter